MSTERARDRRLHRRRRRRIKIFIDRNHRTRVHCKRARTQAGVLLSSCRRRREPSSRATQVCGGLQVLWPNKNRVCACVTCVCICSEQASEPARACVPENGQLLACAHSHMRRHTLHDIYILSYTPSYRTYYTDINTGLNSTGVLRVLSPRANALARIPDFR